jgi:hypothetical protein
MPFEESETITKANAPPEATVTYDFAQKKGTVRKADVMIGIDQLIHQVTLALTMKVFFGWN